MMERLKAGAREWGMVLSPRQLQQFEGYFQALSEGNRRVNLTRITAYEEVQIKHFLDSLAAAPLLLVGSQRENSAPFSLLDMGSGAGFPGVPLRILFPQVRLTLLESVKKKTTFLQLLLQTLGLEETSVFTGRAEDLARHPIHREQYDVVTARGVAKLSALAELVLPFCRLGGKAIAWKQGTVESEVERAGRALQLLGGRLERVERYRLPGQPQERSLVLLRKVGPTPEAYPRRAGMPVKHPL